MKRLIFDLDGTICFAINGYYMNATPNHQVIDVLRSYKLIDIEKMKFFGTPKEYKKLIKNDK
jgi:hypothetical protein